MKKKFLIYFLKKFLIYFFKKFKNFCEIKTKSRKLGFRVKKTRIYKTDGRLFGLRPGGSCAKISPPFEYAILSFLLLRINKNVGDFLFAVYIGFKKKDKKEIRLDISLGRFVLKTGFT